MLIIAPPNPDKRDKYLYEIIFCQKRTENYFLDNNNLFQAPGSSYSGQVGIEKT